MTTTRAVLILLALSSLGCTSKEGEKCSSSKDCAEGLVCNGTVCGRCLACASIGECVIDDGRCVVGNVEDCKKSRACATQGACGIVDEPAGKMCAVTSDADCKGSAECKDEGRCAKSKSQPTCVVADDEGCEAASVCRTEGRCKARPASDGEIGRCVKPPPPKPTLPEGYALQEGDLWSLGVPEAFEKLDKETVLEAIRSGQTDQPIPEELRQLVLQNAGKLEMLLFARDARRGPVITLLREPFTGSAQELLAANIRGLPPSITVLSKGPETVAGRPGSRLKLSIPNNTSLVQVVPVAGKAYTLTCNAVTALQKEQEAMCQQIAATLWIGGEM